MRSFFILLRFLTAFIILCADAAHAQSRREDIYTDVVLYQKRVALEKDLRTRIIDRAFSSPVDSNTEDRYLSACWAISQYLFYSPMVEQGFHQLIEAWPNLSYDTKHAFLEAVYAVTTRRYADTIAQIIDTETDPKLFAIGASYCYRADSTVMNSNEMKIRMVERFPGYDTIPVLHELANYLSYHNTDLRQRTPDIAALLRYRAIQGKKTVFSFQRYDRDQPGLAIVMDEQGRIVRDGAGNIQVFRQLARSGPDLPYFITNGSTPQGIYRITGTDVSRTTMIGPTPNLQLIMPFENTWNRFFDNTDTATQPTSTTQPPAFDSCQQYLQLMPPEWRSYRPMMESWTAGQIGRTEIIAHGTTIDPEYFKDKPFYPLTPTMGCLCAKEQWNPTSGRLLVSEQFNLISAFLSTPGRKGYLFVINLDNQHKPVSRREVEDIVQKSILNLQ